MGYPGSIRCGMRIKPGAAAAGIHEKHGFDLRFILFTALILAAFVIRFREENRNA